MSDEQANLTDIFERGPRAKVGEGSRDQSLPGDESASLAFARRSNKPEFSLHFITPAGTMRSFQYAHLDSDSGFTAECITLRFMGLEPQKVLIVGRNLRQLYDYIHQHRTAWVREAARPLGDDDEPIVTKVVIRPVNEDVRKPGEN